MVIDGGMKIAMVAIGAAAGVRLFFWLAPVLQGEVSAAQFVVARLHRRAQRATYLAYAADQFVVAYRQAKADDKSLPRSAWMEVGAK